MTKQKPSRQVRSRKASALQYVGYGTDQDRAALLERLPDAFVSVDPQWHFTYVNAQAETLLGKKREELLGRNVWEVFLVPRLIGKWVSLKRIRCLGIPTNSFDCSQGYCTDLETFGYVFKQVGRRKRPDKFWRPNGVMMLIGTLASLQVLYTSSTTFPVVRRSAMARWASAASARG